MRFTKSKEHIDAHLIEEITSAHCMLFEVAFVFDLAEGNTLIVHTKSLWMLQRGDEDDGDEYKKANFKREREEKRVTFP